MQIHLDSIAETGNLSGMHFAPEIVALLKQILVYAQNFFPMRTNVLRILSPQKIAHNIPRAVWVVKKKFLSHVRPSFRRNLENIERFFHATARLAGKNKKTGSVAAPRADLLRSAGKAESEVFAGHASAHAHLFR
jgi:hypothetical protein